MSTHRKCDARCAVLESSARILGRVRPMAKNEYALPVPCSVVRVIADPATDLTQETSSTIDVKLTRRTEPTV